MHASFNPDPLNRGKDSFARSRLWRNHLPMTTTPAFRPPYPLDLAGSEAEVERRLEAYINDPVSHASVRLKRILSSFTDRFERVAIIGGMVRDFARVGAPGFHSDVDLVIDAPVAEVMAFAAARGARLNAFGGFSAVADGWEIDFWALETTWAVREGHVVVRRLEDVIGSTFFDHDAIIYDLRHRRIVCGDDYIARQRLNTLEINLLPNPSINGGLYRASRRLLGWELSPGPKLTAFIDRHLDEGAFQHMRATEQRKDAARIVQAFGTAADLRTAILAGRPLSSIGDQ